MASWIDKYNARQDIGGQIAPNMAIQQLSYRNTPKKKQKGFWTDQISTGGGIAGALGGGVAGAAAGSVVPVVGTAIGGILGALLGGAGGSAAGEIGENAITGDSWDKNVAKEALIGGATSLPIGAGFKLARAGLKAGTGIGKKAASDLIQEAGVQTIGKGTVAKGAALGQRFDDDALTTLRRLQGGKSRGVMKTSLQGRFADSGNKALASQYGVLSNPTRRAADPARTVQELADIGITKPADAERIGSAITGSEGVLTEAVTKAVGGAKDVDTSTMRQVFNDALDNYGIVEKDRKSLQTLFDAQLTKLSGGARGSLNPKVNPTEALQTMKAFEKRIANLRGKGGNYRMTTPEREDAANVLQLVRDELEDQLYVGAGANKNLKNVLTPELREKLVSLKPKDAKWANYVDNNIMKATDVSQLRSAQSPFVRVGQMIDEGEDAMFSMGGRLAPSANGIRGALLDGATNLVKNPAARGYAAVTRGAGALPRMGAAGVGQSLPGLAVRQGVGRGILGALTASEAPQALEDVLAAQTALTAPQDMSQGMVEEPSIGGITKSQLEQAMMMAAMDGNDDAFGQLQAMYDLLPDPAANNLSAAASKQATLAANGEAAVDQIEQLLGAAGGGSGAVGGRIQELMAGIDVDQNAKLYNDSLGGFVDAITKARGKTDAPSEVDREMIMASLPRLTDTPENAAKKIQILRQMLATARDNALMYGADMTAADVSQLPSQ